jgi:hypothetical protein
VVEGREILGEPLGKVGNMKWSLISLPGLDGVSLAVIVTVPVQAVSDHYYRPRQSLGPKDGQAEETDPVRKILDSFEKKIKIRAEVAKYPEKSASKAVFAV